MSGKRIGMKPAWLIGLAVLALVSVAGWYVFAREKPTLDKPTSGPSSAIPVEVVTPLSGGLDRACVQPGTVEPFESADLYAKVSGYLVEQTVDIG
jgi:HlyD family secretion protein